MSLLHRIASHSLRSDFGRSHWIGLALVRQSSTLPEAYKAVAPSDDYARIQEDPERDLKNFPRPVQASEPPKVRLGFLPDDWFQFFYKKTGVTGPYLFGTGLITFLCSKEIYVMEHEYYTGLSLAFIVIYAVKKFGPQMKAWIKKESESEENALRNFRESCVNFLQESVSNEKKSQWYAQGQKYLFDAKRENITLQLESAFRQRQLEVFNEVKRRLDYHVEMDNTKRRFQHQHMVNWIVDNVKKSITPDLEKETLKQCLSDLRALSVKA